MSSGERRVIISMDERAAPDDIVRLQDISAQARNDALRYLVPAEIRGDFYSNPGLVAPFVALPAAPPTDVEIAHTCLSGLLVRPDNPGFLLVDPGVAGFFVPAFGGTTADDSPWILVDSPGVSSAVALVFVANGGPGIRWDIVECQPAADAITENATRDVFDPGTQTVAPQVVPKVRRSVLTFRIRQGVQGNGVPDIDPAWMPLAAVHVRTDSAGFTTTDLYDIRPLLTDRAPFSMRHPLSVPAGGAVTRGVLHEAGLGGNHVGVLGKALSGYFRGQFGGYWSGGTILKNMPATDLADFGDTSATGASFPRLNLEDAKNRSAGFALVASTVLTVGAFFPRGYPRWVRYSQAAVAPDATNRLRPAATVRVPQGSRGILMALSGPDGGGLVARNGIISPATLPTAFGETVGAWGHVVGYAAVSDSGTDVYPGQGEAGDKRFVWEDMFVTTGGALDPSITQLASLPGPAVTADLNTAALAAFIFTLTPGSNNVPKNASAVLVSMNVQITVANAGFVGPLLPASFVAADSTGFAQLLPISIAKYQNDSGGSSFYTANFVFWLPLRPNATYDGSAAVTTRVAVNFFGGGMSAPGGATQIHGYQL